MAHFYDMQKKIIDRFKASYTGLPVIYDNDDAKGINILNGFIQFSIVVTRSDPATINGYNPKYRSIGFIKASLMLPDNTGIKDSLQLSDTISNIFRAKSFDGVFCYTPFIDNGKKVEYNKGNFYNVEWFCPFRYDEHIPL